jgi:hypothetical protein
MFPIRIVRLAYYGKSVSRRMFNVCVERRIYYCSVLDALSLMLWGHAIYWYLVLNFGNLMATTSIVW